MSRNRVMLALAVIGICLVVYFVTRNPENSAGFVRDAGAEGSTENRTLSSMHSRETPTELSRLAREALDAGVPTHTIRDARLREEMRRKIMEAWTHGSAEPDPSQAPPRETHFESMPQRPDGGIDPSYIQQRIHEDFFPMAKGCYADLLARDPKAAGKIIVNFKIVGDEKIGGIVDEATISDDSTLKDEKMQTCFRESVMSVAFRPPPAGGGGVVTVTYPVIFSQDPPDE